jgi:hypothetical protein
MQNPHANGGSKPAASRSTLQAQNIARHAPKFGAIGAMAEEI